jgi:hypothetical protein
MRSVSRTAAPDEIEIQSTIHEGALRDCQLQVDVESASLTLDAALPIACYTLCSQRGLGCTAFCLRVALSWGRCSFGLRRCSLDVRAAHIVRARSW